MSPSNRMRSAEPFGMPLPVAFGCTLSGTFDSAINSTFDIADKCNYYGYTLSLQGGLL